MEVQKNIKLCEICKDEEAATLCFDCHSYFCEICYKFVHDLKKNPEHKKELIEPFISFDLKCSLHKAQPNSLFCLEDKSNYNSFNATL